MGSRRGLAALAAVAVLMVAAVVADFAGVWLPAPAPAPATGRLLPGCGAVQRIAWHRPGAPPVVLQPEDCEASPRRCTPGGDMALAGVDGPVDEAAVADVLGTLELLSYRRRLPADRTERGLDAPRVRLEVTCADGAVTTLALGNRIEQVDRVWLARGDDAATDYLIEGYAARALDRGRDELRARRVFAVLGERAGDPFAAGVERIEIQRGARTRVLVNSPPMLQMEPRPDGNVRADPAVVAKLGDRLRELSIARFVDAAPGPDARAPGTPGQGEDRKGDGRKRDGRNGEGGRTGGLRVRVHGPGAAAVGPGGDAAPGVHALVELGPCPGEPTMRLVSASPGTGCVDAGALDAVAAFLGEPMVSRHLVAPEARLAEIRIAPARAPAVTLVARGSAWHMRTGGAEIETETEAVHAWLAALARGAGGALVPAAQARPGPRVLAVTFVHADGRTEELALFRSGWGARWLARRGREPVFLALEPAAVVGAQGILPAGPARFRRRQLLALEPYGLREVVARRGGQVVAHLVRGALLSDWRVQVPAGRRLRAGAVEEIREIAARLRARRFLADGPAHGLRPPRRQVDVVFDPGPLDADPAPRRHRIDIGARTAAGCAARLDDGPAVIELDRAACDVLLGPWTR